MNFIPNKCHWFVVGEGDAYSGNTEILLVPGTEDFEFTLKLKQNPEVDCTDFNFYDKFNDISFDFVIDSYDETFIEV